MGPGVSHASLEVSYSRRVASPDDGREQVPSPCEAMRLVHMDDFVVRCPRCKQSLSSGSADELADSLIAHVEEEHGHAPPREHVLARIERHDPAG